MPKHFKTLQVLPLYDVSKGGPPHDGMALKTNEFCKDKYGERCEKFYQSVSKDGFHQCPYGYAVRSFSLNGHQCFYSSLVVADVADIPRLRPGDRLSQPLTQEFVDGCVKQIQSFQSIRSDFNLLKRDQQHLADTIHEIRIFNSQLKANCESHPIDIATNHPERTILSNLSISQMITSRLEYMVFKMNPRQTTQEQVSFFRKLDKVIKTIRAEADLWQVKIEKIGSSFKTMLAFSFIEQVPALLIQNAVKYSVPGTTVKVEIAEGFQMLNFSVENTGPFIYEDEREKVFQKGYRGREAKAFTRGTGTGLWFLRKIVEIHRGTIILNVGKPELYGGSQTSLIKIEVKLPWE